MTYEDQLGRRYLYQPPPEQPSWAQPVAYRHRHQLYGEQSPQPGFQPPGYQPPGFQTPAIQQRPPQLPPGQRRRHRPDRRPHSAGKVILGVIGALALFLTGYALGRAGTGTSGGSGTLAAAPAGAAGHRSAHRSVHHAASASTGTTFRDVDSNGNPYRVTLVRVIDPARGADSFDQAPPGKRLVGAVFRVTGTGNAASDDSNGDATLQGSNGQTYQFSVDAIRGYTNFNSGTFSVSAGQSQAGAVVFEVPDHVKIAEVQWTADPFGGAAQTWRLRR